MTTRKSDGVAPIDPRSQHLQGKAESGTGLPSDCRQTALPVLASKAWTMLSSVATNSKALFDPDPCQ